MEITGSVAVSGSGAGKAEGGVSRNRCFKCIWPLKALVSSLFYIERYRIVEILRYVWESLRSIGAVRGLMEAKGDLR